MSDNLSETAMDILRWLADQPDGMYHDMTLCQEHFRLEDMEFAEAYLELERSGAVERMKKQ